MFKNEEGFSLLELVVAVGVAGIIAAVALPTFAGIQDKATTTSATYAASASAAEALANSTIGNTGGNSSSSQVSSDWITVSLNSGSQRGLTSNGGTRLFLEGVVTTSDPFYVAAQSSGLAGHTVTFHITEAKIRYTNTPVDVSYLNNIPYSISWSHSEVMMGVLVQAQLDSLTIPNDIEIVSGTLSIN